MPVTFSDDGHLVIASRAFSLRPLERSPLASPWGPWSRQTARFGLLAGCGSRQPESRRCGADRRSIARRATAARHGTLRRRRCCGPRGRNQPVVARICMLARQRADARGALWDGDLRPAHYAVPVVPRHSRRVDGPTLVAGRGVARRADVAVGTSVVQCKKCCSEKTNRRRCASRKDDTVKPQRKDNGIAASVRQSSGDQSPGGPSGLRCDDTRAQPPVDRSCGARSVTSTEASAK